MSSLNNLAHTNVEKVAAFYADEPALADLIDESLTVTWHPTVAFTKAVTDTDADMWVGQMLQTLHGYFRNSALLLITDSFDEGFGLLRMASELARDISCIATTPSLLPVWLRRRDSKDAQRAYKKAFHFDTTSPKGRNALAAYEFACCYGTHGHLTTLFSARPTPNDDSNMVSLTPTTKEVVDMLRVWLSTLFSLYEVALRWDLLPRNPSIRTIQEAYQRSILNAGPIISKQPSRMA